MAGSIWRQIFVAKMCVGDSSVGLGFGLQFGPLMQTQMIHYQETLLSAWSWPCGNQQCNGMGIRSALWHVMRKLAYHRQKSIMHRALIKKKKILDLS